MSLGLHCLVLLLGTWCYLKPLPGCSCVLVCPRVPCGLEEVSWLAAAVFSWRNTLPRPGPRASQEAGMGSFPPWRLTHVKGACTGDAGRAARGGAGGGAGAPVHAGLRPDGATPVQDCAGPGRPGHRPGPESVHYPAQRRLGPVPGHLQPHQSQVWGHRNA